MLDKKMQYMLIASTNKEFADAVGIDQDYARKYVKVDIRTTLESIFNVDRTPPYVFLGGSIVREGTDWRAILSEKLTCPYFDPVVESWSEKDRVKEELVKEHAALNLFTICTDIQSLYSMYELGKSSIEHPYATVFLLQNRSIGDEVHDVKSMDGIMADLKKNKVRTFTDYKACANHINYVIDALTAKP